MFEDVNRLISCRKSNTRQYNGDRKRANARTMIYKTLHIQLKMKQHEHHPKPRVNIDALEGQTVRVASVVLLMLQGEKSWMRTLWLWQMEHIHGHLWHRYSGTVYQVMAAAVKRSKRWPVDIGDLQLRKSWVTIGLTIDIRYHVTAFRNYWILFSTRYNASIYNAYNSLFDFWVWIYKLFQYFGNIKIILNKLLILVIKIIIKIKK